MAFIDPIIAAQEIPYGALTVIAPKSETFAATVAIDATVPLHTIAAASGTSATVTFNAAFVGPAGSELTIITATDGSGTVTATFGTNLHSTGTQATLASKFSSITFISDGTRWVEKSRTTAAT